MPYCSMEEEFVQRFRRKLEVQSSQQEIPEIQHDEEGVAFSQADGTHACTNTQTVLVFIVRTVHETIIIAIKFYSHLGSKKKCRCLKINK